MPKWPKAPADACRHSTGSYETDNQTPPVGFAKSCSGSRRDSPDLVELHMLHKRKHTSSTLRILALDLHPRRFGYVVLETPDRLLDWGASRVYTTTKWPLAVLATTRFRKLLTAWRPGVVLTRIGSRTSKDTHALFKSIKREVGTTLLIPVLADRKLDHKSKYDRAREALARFPEISWMLPKRRQIWEGEHFSMDIFEALSVAIPYLRKPTE